MENWRLRWGLLKCCAIGKCGLNGWIELQTKKFLIKLKKKEHRWIADLRAIKKWKIAWGYFEGFVKYFQNKGLFSVHNFPFKNADHYKKSKFKHTYMLKAYGLR